MVQDTEEHRHLTFSQVHGYSELPRPLALKEVSKEARIKLWDLLAGFVWAYTPNNDYFIVDRWLPILTSLHSEFHLKPLDDFEPHTRELFLLYKGDVLYGLPFNELFDLVQMIMRQSLCPRKFVLGVDNIFKQYQLAYIVDTRRPPTIYPAVTEQEGNTILEAIGELRQAGLDGTETHIRKAGELINQGDWPGSVRESIHAVESIARQLDSRASSTLGPALRSLERSGQLHPALKSAFSSLYGYTSDEEGIRHPLITSAESPVGQDEAVFMLGACASFASYLCRKHRIESER